MIKKLFIVSLSILNLLALTPHAFCTPPLNPFSAIFTFNHIKKSLKKIEFSIIWDFQDYFNRRQKDIILSKIRVKRHGLVRVSLIHSSGFMKKFYFNITELSVTEEGSFNFSRGIKVFNSKVAELLSKPPLTENDITGCIILPNDTTSLSKDAFKNTHVESVYVPKRIKSVDFDVFCECPDITIAIIQD